MALIPPGTVEFNPTAELPAAPTPSAFSEAFAESTTTKPVRCSRFWSPENEILFSANAAFAAADFVVTRDNLNSGGRELNPVTRVFAGSTAGLAVNFAGETAGVIGLSYFFHRAGHHKLERVVSVLNLGSSAGAVTYGLAHR